MSRFFHCFLSASALSGVLLFEASTCSGLAQTSEMQMEKALDIMDKSHSSWNSAPQAAAVQRMPAQSNPMNGYSSTGGNMMAPQMMPQQNPFGMAGASPMFNHPAPMQQPGMSNPFTMQNMLKVMLGGSSGPSSGGNPGASGDDNENLNTALNQKQQAIDSCNSISGERDKGVKEGLASQAQDHANASRYAADALYNSSCNSKSQQVKDMASQARNAANTAQSFADRARSKADGGGW